jgi:hypothetical protein
MAGARSEGSDWFLGDAEEQHRAHPRSFFIPSRAERETLAPGRDVRLSFLRRNPPGGEPSGERMWLQVESAGADGYVGVLKNEPVFIEDLAAFDHVAFAARHVIAVDDPRWAPYEDKRAYVDVRLLEDDDLEPSFARHEPDDDQLDDGTRSSGWQLFAPGRTNEEVNDPANWRMPNLAWLMERYPAFGELVFSGAAEGDWTPDPETDRYLPG